VFGWFRLHRPPEKIDNDRKNLEIRVRRLLQNYLSADEPQKRRYYEVIAGAAAGCQSDLTDPKLDGVRSARVCAERALKVVGARERQTFRDDEQFAELITDAFATVAVAYSRASAAYTTDEEMQKLGTAAVHLLTIATSYVAAEGIA